MTETIAEQFDYWYNERKASVQANMSRSEFIAGLAQFTDPLEARVKELEEYGSELLTRLDFETLDAKIKITTLTEALEKIKSDRRGSTHNWSIAEEALQSVRLEEQGEG